MKVFSAYLNGWALTLKNLKLLGLLYALNFLFALLVSFPVFQLLNDNLAHTVSLDKLYQGFDFTVVNDLLNEYGNVFGFITNQSIITGFLFLLLSVFLSGGILLVFANRNQDPKGLFWRGGAKFYWRIFGLTILFLIVQSLILFLCFSTFNILTDGGLDRFHSEASIYRRAVIIFCIYSVIASIFWMIQDYAKVAMVQEDRSLISSIGAGFRFVFRNFGSTFFLYSLCLLTFGLIYILYWRTPGISSVGLAFFIGQAFLLYRICTKLLNLASASLWYEQQNGTKGSAKR